MGGAEAELDCVGTVAVSKPWDKGETELIFHPSVRIPQLAFLTRSYSEFSFPFVSAPLAAHSLSSLIFLFDFYISLRLLITRRIILHYGTYQVVPQSAYPYALF